MVNQTTRIETLPPTRLPSGLIRQETRVFGLPSFEVSPIERARRAARRGLRVERIPIDREQAMAEARRRAEFERAKQLLAKAQTKLLTPSERAQLERITAPTFVTRAQILARPRALTRVEQLQQRQQRQLEAQRRQVLGEQEKLDIRQRELEGRFRVLQRLKEKQLLTPALATEFNKRVEELRKDQETLIGRAQVAQKKIAEFKEPAPTRVKPKPTTFIAAAPTERELIERAIIPAKQVFPTPKQFKKRVIETGELVERLGIGKRFGAGKIIGFAVGGVSEAFETGFRGVGFLGERAVRGFERITKKPFEAKFKVPVGTAKVIKGIGKVPFVGEPFKGLQVSPVKAKRGVFEVTIRKPQVVTGIKTAAELELLFGFPVARALAKAGVVTKARIIAAEGFRAPSFRPTLRFEAPTPKVRVPTKEELKIKEILRRKIKTPREVREMFAAIQKRPTQKEIEKLLRKPSGFFVKPLPPTKEARKFAKITLPKPKPILPVKKEPFAKAIKPKPKKTIVIRFPELGEKGGLVLRKPKLRVIQIPKPRFLEPIRLRVGAPRRARVVRLKDVLKKFEVRPTRVFRVPREAQALFGAGVLAQALTLKEKELLFGVPKEFFKEFEKIGEAQRAIQARRARLSELAATATLSREAEAVREAQRQRERQRQIERQLTRAITKTVTVPRFREPIIPRKKIVPRKPPVLVLPKLKELEEKFIGKPKKVQGFVAVVKEKPFAKKRFKKVSKALPKEVALQRAMSVVDRTIAQSAKVRKAKKKVKPQPKPLTDLRFKFRKKGNVFIEKRKHAIDTIGEKQELTVDKFLAQERKKMLGLPLRKKGRKKRGTRKRIRFI